VETQSEQEKMDQLMAELQGEAAAGGGVPAEPESDPANPGDTGEDLSEQGKMDQLMAELQGQVAQEGAEADEGAPEEAEAPDQAEEPPEQEKMDQLMAELQGETGQGKDGGRDAKPEPSEGTEPSEPEGPDEELSEQEKMDRLMAELQGGGSSGKPDPSEAAASSDPEDPDEDLSEQEKMDRLMAELQGGGNGGKPEPSDAAEASESEGPEEDLSDQDKMDRLMAELQGEAGGPEPADDNPEEDPEDEAGLSDTSDDDFQSLDEDETDLEGYGEETDTFEALDEDEEDLAGYADDEDAAVADEMTAPETTENTPDPEPKLQHKPVPRERKSLFNHAEERVTALPESSRRGPWPRILLISSGITILLAALFTGFTVYKHRGDGTAVKPVVSPEEIPSQAAAAPDMQAKPGADARQAAMEAHPVPADDPAAAIIKDRFATIDALRQALQIKQADIVNLKQDYESGNEQSLELIAGLAAEKQIKDFKSALAVRRIAFELQTVQRRKAYIHKLEDPHNRLLAGSEALLYIKRLTEIDLAVAPFVGDLGAGRLLKRIDAEIDRHQLTSDKLQVAAGDAGVPDLESLWQAALRKSRPNPAGGRAAGRDPADSSPPVAEVKLSNSEIWGQICNDQPDNKYRLTELTTEAAACLAKWEGKELFLNRLTTLTSRQARALAEWEGEWIGLNGLTEMDRATARALFKWPGKRLSLNGFTEFPPSIARYLAKWKGKQLELMGLELLSHKTAVYFMEWKKAGGQLYIPNKFYRRK